MLEKMQPIIRRDCNYANIERIKKSSVWNEDQSQWIVPEVALQTYSSSGSISSNNSTYSEALPLTANSKYYNSGNVVLKEYLKK